jgi:putative membrane protein
MLTPPERLPQGWSAKAGHDTLSGQQERVVTIKNFTDHAANERTFLAWVRTAIAVTAFGFLVERFDLFLAAMAPNGSGKALTVHRSGFGREAGLILIAAGVAMTVLSAVRFMKTAREIDLGEVVPGTGSRLDIALAALLALLGVALFFYLSRAFMAGSYCSVC